MYTSITELPTQVTASLDDKDAKVWMDRYNALINDKPTDKDVAKARRGAWEACKNLPSSFSFCIKASIEDVDKDKEIIDIGSIKDHLDSFIKYGGNVQAEHGNYNVATIWGWDPIKEDGMDGVEVWGNIFGGDQVQDEARKAFINGRNNLSVAGEATEGKFQCDHRGCYTRRHVKQLLEISLCDVPANKHATMLWYNKKAKMTKSADESIRMNVNEYTIHKDYTNCPIQKMKRDLLDSGYVNVHAKSDGVLIKVEESRATAYAPNLIVKGYHVSLIPEGLYVQSREKSAEYHFKKALNNKYITCDGQITSEMPQEEFISLFENGLIQSDNNGHYRFTY